MMVQTGYYFLSLANTKIIAALKNFNRDGYKYRSNLKAWMARVIFVEWLRGFDMRMTERNSVLIRTNAA